MPLTVLTKEAIYFGPLATDNGSSFNYFNVEKKEGIKLHRNKRVMG
jgi:hypothetical protein